MKKKFLSLFSLTQILFAYSQVGINTSNPQGAFNVDSSKDNASSGTPSLTEQLNDFVVIPGGNVGIGLTSPSSKLEIRSGTTGVSGLKFSNMNSSTAPSSGQTLGVDASGNVITIPNAATASVSTQEVSIGGSGPAQSSNKFDVNDTGWTTVKNSNQTVIVPAGGRAVFINFMLGIDYISNPPGGGGGYYTAKLYIDGVATNVFLTAQEPTYGAQAQFSLSTVKALTEGSHTIEVRMSRTYNNGTTAGAEMTCAMMSMSLNSSYIN